MINDNKSVGACVTSIEDSDSANLRKQVDHDDLQREFSGVGGARMRRFLPQHMSDQERREKRRKADEAYLTALQILLLDPAYNATFAQTRNLLAEAQSSVDRVRERLLEGLGEIEGQLAQYRANASRLPDGTLVFRGGNDELIDENGNKLDEAQRDSLIWSEAMPSWTDYNVVKEQRQALHQELEIVDEYECEIIIPGKARIADEDNPLSLDELDELQREIQSEMPESVRIEFDEFQNNENKADISEKENTVAVEYGHVESEFEKREIMSSFEKVRLDIPDVDEKGIDELVNLDIDIKPF